jgi:hypothetical protein
MSGSIYLAMRRPPESDVKEAVSSYVDSPCMRAIKDKVYLQSGPFVLIN